MDFLGRKEEKGKGAVPDCAIFPCSTAEVQRSGAGFGQPLSKQRFCLLESQCSLVSGKSQGNTLGHWAVLTRCGCVVGTWCLLTPLVLEQTVVNFLESSLCACKNLTDSVVRATADTLQGPIQSAYREAFQSVVLPAFEKSCQSMFQQINDTFKQGTQECE